MAIVAAQQEYRFREPGFEGGCHAAFGPKRKMSMKILARSKPGWPSDEADVCLEGNRGLTRPVRRASFSLNPRLRCVGWPASSAKWVCARPRLRRDAGRASCA